MLRACVIDFGGSWNQFLQLAEFAYNYSYQSSIQMDPYEVLYRRRCRSPVGWFELGEASFLGTDLVQDTLVKVKVIQDRLCTAQLGQKSYADRKKYIGDPSHVLNFSTVQLDSDLAYDMEPVAILEGRLQKLRSKDITSVKVQWTGQPVEVATWDTEQEIWSRYPHLFEASDIFLDPFKDERLFKKGRM
ncbi:uncharacterized protein [Nicotiana sylvestris]|uniref:uncharacterized protein n=1 Tax=Nicotiana sylvestris TaxID=4096 RepID=UPI00388CD0A3